MPKLAVLTLIMSCIAFIRAVSAADFGIGFSLSFDYGYGIALRLWDTALTLHEATSIYFTDGSAIGIARIEGGWEHKQMMRAQNWSMPSTDSNVEDNLARSPSSQPSQLASGINLQHFRDHLRTG
ncbi:hypothetical protein K431DRAFT_296447 [Polychaeton citri CBS 116435]|uniref:Uncharacterized protein n=1 Tax=Polychaeton citri CBS 116435 TaxID=1314669 RepID=A0A9P4Q3R4_9PEZI|nr:hypothetical protein K431DRAFT_296447 [Polychaeton citri CBS 116435]